MYNPEEQYGARYVAREIRQEPTEIPGPIGAWYSPDIIEIGQTVFHSQRDYGECSFERWDGGYAVIRTGKELLSPTAPKSIPRLGATPKGAKVWADVADLMVKDE